MDEGRRRMTTTPHHHHHVHRYHLRNTSAMRTAEARRLLAASCAGGQAIGRQLQQIADRYDYEFRLRVGCAEIGRQLRRIADDFDANPFNDRRGINDLADALFSAISNNQVNDFDVVDAGESAFALIRPSNWSFSSFKLLGQVALSAFRQRASLFVGGLVTYVIRRLIFASIYELFSSSHRRNNEANNNSQTPYHHRCRFDRRNNPLLTHHSPSLSSADHLIAVAQQQQANRFSTNRLDGEDVFDFVQPPALTSNTTEAEDDDDDDDDVFLLANRDDQPQTPRAWYRNHQQTVNGFVSTPQARRFRYS